MPLVAPLEPHRPLNGLALAPWRLNQVAGRSQGQYPHATLDAYILKIIYHIGRCMSRIIDIVKISIVLLMISYSGENL